MNILKALGQTQCQVGSAGLAPEQAGPHLLCSVSMLMVCCWLLQFYMSALSIPLRRCWDPSVLGCIFSTFAPKQLPLEYNVLCPQLQEGLLVSAMQTDSVVSTTAVGARCRNCSCLGELQRHHSSWILQLLWCLWS